MKTSAEEPGLNVNGWKQLIENAHTHKINKEIQSKEIETIKVKTK